MTNDSQRVDVAARRITAIDLGTNSFHALLVDIYPDRSYRVIDSLKEMVNLGEDVLQQYLSPEGMQRGIEALRKIRRLCDSKEVEDIVAYATSAIRESKNGGDFIEQVLVETGIKIQAIPGLLEAELIGYAVQHGMYLNDEPVLIMDIGGGSVEFIIANRDQHYYLDSQKIGVSRIVSQFIHGVDLLDRDQLKRHYAEHLGDLFEAMKPYEIKVLIGTSGTLQNIAQMMAFRLKKDVSITLNEFEYPADDLLDFYQTFGTLSRQEKLKVPLIDPKRVDSILPVLVLMELLINQVGIASIRTCTDALREGIILSYIRREMKTLEISTEFPDPRKRSVYELLRKCSWHEKHSKHVVKLALHLFDELKSYHDLREKEREWLEYAGLMHDIGYHISFHRHHKHALYLILNADLKGFSQEEIQIMGHVARYHRSSIPNKSHDLYLQLTEFQKDRVKKLAGLLRVADGLDRSHFQSVDQVDVMVGRTIKLTIKTKDNPELEIWGAMRKRELFEWMFNRPLEIVAV